MLMRESCCHNLSLSVLADDRSHMDKNAIFSECAQAFQSMSQEEESPHQYEPLAHFLVSERFLEHGSPDVRLLVACCVADVFRVFAPDAPYEDEAQIKMLLEFFIDHLEGLSDTQSPSFKRHFYLLENLSVVKTFNICMEIPDTQAIICRLFDLMFKVIKSNMRIKRFIVDLLTPFCDSDYLNQDLLDTLLMHIVEPYKSQNVNGYLLAREIIQKSATYLEPFLTATFNAELVLGVSERKSAKYFTTRHLFDLIYELNIIYPPIMLKVFPELANKVRNCNNEIERMDVTKLAVRILANKNSNLIENENILWKEFLQRFYDKEICVREFCAKSIKTFLLIHPESKDDITNALITTHRDVSEHIRFTVIASILAAAKEDIFSINEQLLDYVQDRMLDKKYEVRKEAILGLGKLFNKYVLSGKYGNGNKLIKMLDLSKSGLLNIYYQPFPKDRMLIERILYTCLVPYQKPKKKKG
ncbi:sister chromatid cohesion protein PDS5 homolog B-A [Caerostris extrusa]|uniref:Sister chromatid cohesion protein PDS5 homolog B-A n=1 Tax=Caerostris extrusa TaxID=172846 RepID=A0AAV4Y4A1_CAEEX|nr:sister chromatid cohesion protein PDS5 homolog B-A [Caerostris extrusa]